MPLADETVLAAGARRRVDPVPEIPGVWRVAGMKCPFCGADETTVADTRINDDGDIVRRRRRCLKCDKRFTTYERAELRLPQVIKKNGSRVDFDREKLAASLWLALRKRPVSSRGGRGGDQPHRGKTAGAWRARSGFGEARRDGHARVEEARQGGLRPLRLGVSEFRGRGRVLQGHSRGFAVAQPLGR
jgi:hypothetical protein